MNEPVLLSQIFLTGDCWQKTSIENKYYSWLKNKFIHSCYNSFLQGVIFTEGFIQFFFREFVVAEMVQSFIFAELIFANLLLTL